MNSGKINKCNRAVKCDVAIITNIIVYMIDMRLAYNIATQSENVSQEKKSKSLHCRSTTLP